MSMEYILKIFSLEKGEYFFRFVPNGSSPEILSITLSGDTFDFSEDFKLVGIPHQTEISEYFTWKYDGQKNIVIPEMQEVSITHKSKWKNIGFGICRYFRKLKGVNPYTAEH